MLNCLSFLCMEDVTTERSFDSQATWVIEVLGILFEMLSVGVCINGHWQMPCQLLQELNVCTVYLCFDKWLYHIANSTGLPLVEIMN